MTAGFPPKDSIRSTLFASLAASGRVESEKASHLRVAAHWLGPLPIAQKLSPITCTMHRKFSMAQRPQLFINISLYRCTLCTRSSFRSSLVGRLGNRLCLWHYIVHVQMVSLQAHMAWLQRHASMWGVSVSAADKETRPKADAGADRMH